ncbi:acetate--CoA ligase family protein [Mycobacterium sp. C31M]
MKTPARPLGEHSMAEFFSPRSIAVVGASDTSGWSNNVVQNNRIAGFTGELVGVHPRHKTVFGAPAVPSLRDLDHDVDLAFIIVGTNSVEAVVDDAIEAKIRNIVVVSAGFRESGDDGRVLQDRLATKVDENGLTMLGPNCIGFVNAHSRVAPLGAAMPPAPFTAGPVAVVTQSGSLAGAVLRFMRGQAVGLSLLATLGNEATTSAVDVINHLITDDQTRVIALFLEEISDAAAFADAARRAAEAGKPIVALKAGSSPLGQEIALAHTGAIAGDDAVVNAFLEANAVVRVRSLEELVSTAALLAYHPAPRGRRLGVFTFSGGACDLIADRADELGLQLPQFGDDTASEMRTVLPDGVTIRNPLDVTGVGLARRGDSALTPVDRAVQAGTHDPNLDVMISVDVPPPNNAPADPEVARLGQDRLDALVAAKAESPVPIVFTSMTCCDLGPYGHELLSSRGLVMMPSIDLTMSAIDGAARWHVARERLQSRSALSPADPPVGAVDVKSGVWSEAEGRDLLEQLGFPVVPGRLVHTAAEAVAVAQELGDAVAMKLCSAAIAHKSDIGGVALGLREPEEIAAAFDRLTATGRAALDGGELDGILVTAMRSGGVELLVGVSSDPVFGPVLTVGFGGVWVEILRDASTRILPVTAVEIKEMLMGLRGSRLLTGARGARPVDLDRLAETLVRLNEVPAALGDRFAFEINPVWVNGDRFEALDVLVVGQQDSGR